MLKKLKTLITLTVILTLAVSVCAITAVAAAAPKEATLTVSTSGGTPQVTEGSFSELITYMRSVALPTKATTYTLVLNTDVTWSGSWIHALNSYATFNIDLNGHNLTCSKNGVLFTPKGGMKINIDGADEQGKIGTLTHTGTGGFLYLRSSSDAAESNANTVATVKNLNIVYTNLSAGYSDTSTYPNQPMMHIPQGTLNMEKVKMTYTGKDATFSSTSYAATELGATGISAMSTEFLRINGGKATVRDCELIDKNSKSIKTIGISASSGATVSAYGTKISAYNGIIAKNTATVNADGCDISARDALYTAYHSGAKINVKDTASRPAIHSKFVSGAGTVTLKRGEGKNTVYSTSFPIGDFTVESGSSLCTVKYGEYAVLDPATHSTVRMPSRFADYCVFQRGEPIKISGYCEKNGATITVELAGRFKTATVSGGKWSVTFDAMDAARDLTLKVTQSGADGSSPLVFSHIDIGEVWLISGQSNAAYVANRMEDFEEHAALADAYGNIRAMVSPNISLPTADPYGQALWCEVNSTTLAKNSSVKGDISAIGLVMATRLAEALGGDVTVAIVDATYPGTKIKTWIMPEKYVAEFGAADVDGNKDYTKYNEYKSFYQTNGRLPETSSEVTNYIAPASVYSNLLSGNYNSIMEQLEGYSVKGVMWYQGESDLGSTSYHPTYMRMFKALLSGWRANFGNADLPVAVIQLAPYGVGTGENNKGQYELVYTQSNKNVYLVNGLLEGCVFGYDELAYTNAQTSDALVHPARKAPIGNRLADCILKNVYKLDGNYITEAPEVVKIVRSGSKLVITFDTDIKFLYGASATGFEIAGSDGVFYKATASTSGKTITVSSDSVTTPTEVRYGYGKMLIELQSGRLLNYNRDNATQDSSTRVVKLTISSTEVITVKEGDVIRSRANGSVTNASGHPMPVFRLSAGYVRAN